MARVPVLVASKSSKLRERLRKPEFGEFEVMEAADWTDASASRQESLPQLVIIECAETTDPGGLPLVRRIRTQAVSLPLILISRHSSESQAVAAFRAGVDDYLTWPLGDSELRESIHRVLTGTGRSPRLVPGPTATSVRTLIGENPSMINIKAFLPKVAATDCTVLITGETGTGKECVAREIHRLSRRQDKSFAVVNCAALPDTLVESELFGYERGAFTGANTPYNGRIKLAFGGTVFFDEIGDMSSYAQAKVLRVLENKEITPLGGKKSVPADVRFITATNQDLQHLISAHRFRQDLYFRINVARIHLPPLRERKEDIPLLLAHFADAYAPQFGSPIARFSEEALSYFYDYTWPGNVRELKNVVEMLLIQQPPRVIHYVDLPDHFRQTCCARRSKDAMDERAVLLSTLVQTNWNKSKTAKQLNWSRMTVYRKMAQYRIQQSDGHREDAVRATSSLVM